MCPSIEHTAKAMIVQRIQWPLTYITVQAFFDYAFNILNYQTHFVAQTRGMWVEIVQRGSNARFYPRIIETRCAFVQAQLDPLKKDCPGRLS